MPLWLWLVDSLVALVAVVVIGLGLVVVRRRSIERRPGAFELTLSKKPSGAAGWVIGTGVYDGDRLQWFRTFSLSWRPTLVLSRDRVEVSGRRRPGAAEASLLTPGAVVVDCTTPERTLRMAMAPLALTGLLAWLESSPPGHGVNRVL